MDSMGRNIIDKYSGWITDLIKEDIQKTTLPYAVAGQHINGDFNLSCIIRSANSFGAREVFYIGGKKKWDKRGAVGVNHYSHIKYIETINELKALKEKYYFVALENNIDRHCIEIYKYTWKRDSLIIIGEENSGIVPEILDLCDDFVSIPNHGSVRSLNAASAASIAMYSFVSQYQLQEVK